MTFHTATQGGSVLIVRVCSYLALYIRKPRFRRFIFATLPVRIGKLVYKSMRKSRWDKPVQTANAPSASHKMNTIVSSKERFLLFGSILGYVFHCVEFD